MTEPHLLLEINVLYATNISFYNLFYIFHEAMLDPFYSFTGYQFYTSVL